MCGAYVTISSIKDIQVRFDVDPDKDFDYRPSVNLRAGDQGLVIVGNQLKSFTFGFTPSWAAKQQYMINARSEGDFNRSNDIAYNGPLGIVEKPFFKKAIQTQRCLVIADAFIEGPTKEKLSRPYLIYKRGERPFAMAGIYDEWINPNNGKTHSTFAILTTTANSFMQLIPHHRSPVILKPEDEQVWLNGKLDQALKCLKPINYQQLNGYPISSKIKDPKQKEHELITPTGKLLVPEIEYISKETDAWSNTQSKIEQVALKQEEHRILNNPDIVNQWWRGNPQAFIDSVQGNNLSLF